nr:SDR family oxidoreductase [Parachlamydia acanthamoebae]
MNVISPGCIDTPRLAHVYEKDNEAMLQNLVKSLPAKRLGEPIEIAKCVLYLFENDYVTGTIQYVDGGYRIAI